MSDVKVVLDIEGIRQIRKMDETHSLILSKANEIASRAGDGFIADTRVGKTRIQGAVKTKDKKSYFRAIHNHALSKALK